jgi:hypothetical protein
VTAIMRRARHAPSQLARRAALLTRIRREPTTRS